MSSSVLSFEDAISASSEYLPLQNQTHDINCILSSRPLKTPFLLYSPCFLISLETGELSIEQTSWKKMLSEPQFYSTTI